MGLREKEILYRMFTDMLMKSIRIPRGSSSKSMFNVLMAIHNEAVKRTTYCLAALDEDFE